MPQRADCVVIARPPMVLHRQPGKLVVFRVTLVILGPVDQVDDVVDLLAGDRLQDCQIIVLLNIGRKPAEQGSNGTLNQRRSCIPWCDYGPTTSNIPHSIVISAVYELPYGHGRHFELLSARIAVAKYAPRRWFARPGGAWLGEP